MSTITGSCLCGAVQFELEDEFAMFRWCHCNECRKATGSAHASNLFTRPDNINWHCGEEQIKRFDLPGQVFSNAFCTACGANVPYVSLSGKALIVPAGSLDRDPVKPDSENIFWSERAGWYDAGLSGKKHAQEG